LPQGEGGNAVFHKKKRGRARIYAGKSGITLDRPKRESRVRGNVVPKKSARKSESKLRIQRKSFRRQYEKVQTVAQ